MKAVLEFILPEDKDDFVLSNNSSGMYSCLLEMSDFLREKKKYGHEYKTSDDALENIRKRFFEILEDNNINLEMVK